MITRLISEKAIPEFLLRMYSSITDWKSASVYSRYAFCVRLTLILMRCGCRLFSYSRNLRNWSRFSLWDSAS